MAALRYVRLPEVAAEMLALQARSPELAGDVAVQVAKAGAFLLHGMSGERPLPGLAGRADLYVKYQGEVVMFVAATATQLAIVKLATFGNNAEFVAAEREARARAARTFA